MLLYKAPITPGFFANYTPARSQMPFKKGEKQKKGHKMKAIKALIFKPEIQVLDLDTFKNSRTIALVNVPEICAKSGKKAQKTLAKNLKNLSEKSTKKARK